MTRLDNISNQILGEKIVKCFNAGFKGKSLGDITETFIKELTERERQELWHDDMMADFLHERG